MNIKIAPLCLIAMLAPAACAPDPAPAPVVAARPTWTPGGIRLALQRGGPEIRLDAARAIPTLGAEARDLVPLIVEAMKDEDPAVVDALRMALCGCGPARPSALLRLRCATKDYCEEVRKGAVWALAQMGRCAEEAVPELVEAVSDPSWSVRRAAMEALVAVGPPSVEPLLDALLEADPLQSRRLIETLDRVQPDGHDALVSMGEPVLHYLLTRIP